jgi:transcriptional regulator with XRE-family HTH domain
MDTEKEKLRQLLSLNLKKWRKHYDYSQEKLADLAGISANMMNDIEGCRTWVSDKTLVRLADALQVDPYRLLVPETFTAEALKGVSIDDVLVDLDRIVEKYRAVSE